MERQQSETRGRTGGTAAMAIGLAACSALFAAGATSADTPGYAGYEQRKQRVLDVLASKPIADDDPVFEGGELEARRALARLVKGTDLAGANNYFGKWGPTADSSQSNDNFTYTYWIRAYFLYKDGDRLTPAAKSRMRKKIGDEWRGFWPKSSENHSMCHASNIYLARQLYGDDLGKIRSWAIDRFVSKAKRGWSELNSPCYAGISMMGIWNLADFADDPVIKKLATMTLDWLLAEYAVENLNMYRGGPFHRAYTIMWDNQYADSFGAHYVFFGNYVVPVVRGALHAALSEYRAPEVIVDIAIDKGGKGSYVLKARRPKGNIYYYVTPEFVLACAQNGGSLRKIGIGGVEKVRAGDQRWDLSFGTGPRAVIHSGSEGKPSQYKNVLVIDTGGKPLKYAPLLGRDFEVNQVEGQWRFIKEGGTYAAIHSESSLYLIEARLASDYESFAAFKDDVQDKPLTGNGPYTYTSTLGDTIEFADRITKVNGRNYDTGDYKLFDSPFVNSEWNSRYVVIRKGDRELILDFRDSADPKRIVRE